jgi:phosphatidate cytidylyltransferase
MGTAEGPSVKPGSPTPVLPGVIGAVLAGLLLLASWIGSLTFVIFVVVIVILLALELYAICLRRNIRVRIVPTIFAMAVLPIAAYIGSARGLGVSVGVVAAALLAVLLFASRGPGFVSSLSATMLFVFYVGLSSSHLILIREFPRGHRMVLLLIAILGGYHLGRWAVQSRVEGTAIVPAVADSVSWVGAAGGLAIALVSAMLMNLLISLGVAAAIAIGFIVAAAAAIGDVGGSMLAEQLGVTRRESWVPGVGGLFARTTTMLFAAPAFFYALRLYLT